jgi:hypothetical protein
MDELSAGTAAVMSLYCSCEGCDAGYSARHWARAVFKMSCSEILKQIRPLCHKYVNIILTSYPRLEQT